jgi:hypothetical protein
MILPSRAGPTGPAHVAAWLRFAEVGSYVAEPAWRTGMSV